MKDILCVVMAMVCLLACKPASTDEQTNLTNTGEYETTGIIERLDSRLDAFIPPEAQIEVLADGFTWTEGPLWIENGQFLLFSDIPPNSVMKWKEGESVSLYLRPSGYSGSVPYGGEPGSNGLLLDPEGRLVLCQHGDRRLARMTAPVAKPMPVFRTIVDRYDGKKFNSPNDAVYDRRGNLFFTDPPYGLPGNMDDVNKELPFQGVYRFSSDGELTLLTDELTRPNGIGLSPDEKTLYVANSDPGMSIWKAFTLDNAGQVLGERIFYDATGSEGKGLPDGLKVDAQGNIWATGPGGVWVFSPEGTVLGKIKTDQATSNCAFDRDYSTLYMTCDDYLMRVRLKL